MLQYCLLLFMEQYCISSIFLKTMPTHEAYLQATDSLQPQESRAEHLQGAAIRQKSALMQGRQLQSPDLCHSEYTKCNLWLGGSDSHVAMRQLYTDWRTQDLHTPLVLIKTRVTGMRLTSSAWGVSSVLKVSIRVETKVCVCVVIMLCTNHLQWYFFATRSPLFSMDWFEFRTVLRKLYKAHWSNGFKGTLQSTLSSNGFKWTLQRPLSSF